MEKKVTTVFIARDGEEFTTESECLEYEKGLANVETMDDMLSLVDDLIQLAFYQRKVLGKGVTTIHSLTKSDGTYYNAYRDEVYDALRDELAEKGAKLDYREIYYQFADAFFELSLTDEKYEELLKVRKG
jgi:hypothetical protein